MPHSTASPPCTVETIINYYKEPSPGEQPDIAYVNAVVSKRKKHNPQTVRVTDLRSTDNHFTIHGNGFQFLPYSGTEGCLYETFSDDDTVKAKVYDEVKQLIKETTGATSVHIFNHICRRDPWQVVLDIPKDALDTDKLVKQHPSMVTHIDQSYKGAHLILQNLSVTNADEIQEQAQKHRWGIINLWKPLRTVTREPLALCDATSVLESDLRPVTLRILAEDHAPHMKEDLDLEMWQIAHNPQHKWYWPSAMRPDEALMFKCFDSEEGGSVARRVPHCAFILPDDHGPPRESVEFRAIVIYGEEGEK